MKNIPLVTIVTVCYNAEKEIEATLESIAQQTEKNFEYVIVDGKSKDNTLDIIKNYEYKFNNIFMFKIISEPDRGIYDAMNKGISMASGVWIIFMNAGDSLRDSLTLLKMKPYLLQSNIDILYGDEYWLEKNNTFLCKPKGADYLPKGSAILHQASFVRSEILRKNPFCLEYKIAGDYESFLKLYVNHYKFQYIPVVIANFIYGGISSQNAVQCLKENIKVREKYGFVNTKTFRFKVGFFKQLIYCFIKTHIPRSLDLIIIKSKNYFIH